MFIGNIAYESKFPTKALKSSSFRTIGRLWYDESRHSLSLLMFAAKTGALMCKPFPNVARPPYLEGDFAITMPYQDRDGVNRKSYSILGSISTTDDMGTPVYLIQLDAIPLGGPRPKDETKYGVYINGFLVDNDAMQRSPDYDSQSQEDTKIVNDEDEDDDLPF